MTRKTIFDIYNEQHVNDVPKVIPNENLVKTENPEIVKTDPETVTETKEVTNNITTLEEDVGTTSIKEERGEDLNGV